MWQRPVSPVPRLEQASWGACGSTARATGLRRDAERTAEGRGRGHRAAKGEWVVVLHHLENLFSAFIFTACPAAVVLNPYCLIDGQGTVSRRIVTSSLINTSKTAFPTEPDFAGVYYQITTLDSM